MIEINLDKLNAIATVRPTSALSEQDFNELASIIDPFIEEQGRLKGLVIVVEKFPGWEDFGSFIRHIRFVKDHQKKVERIAFVADNPGRWMMHCHMIEHMAFGMAAWFQVT